MLSTYTAKNLDDALREACIKKDCRIDELTYNVLEENKGFLGIGSSVKIEAYCLNDVKEFLFDYLGNFFTNANIECSVEIFQKDDSFTIMLDAENNAVLIGKNGKTLQAINTVVKSAVNSEFKRKFKILVDINNYKQERYSKLKSMAIRIAKNVSRTKVDASLDPMSNDERKVIHQALANFKHIKTESEGEGLNRHLVIKYVDHKEEVSE
ncbi:MAG: Jag N-terminal domain-containing protein [Firmicutes bacterium]|nr:Jag N-terminal domain-containing protein [Erysipelotrichaceae bacterium]MDD6524876.1 Jag N-terminal domain-containing protein [Bacillota bacterium]MDD7228451.1 Jag N-terminal domain-containing protein [Bacillota bacterium]MDY4972001.1 RNA-binding cell elongation regulator Jag/EloR [Erysipelotrichaceae bacterium]MDY5997322.1 RNA-binding cell elongation regulator Jag/EloR [Erysipelotrichaceae bacterium]